MGPGPINNWVADQIDATHDRLERWGGANVDSWTYRTGTATGFVAGTIATGGTSAAVRGSAEVIEAGAVVKSANAAAETDTGLVNLASDARTTHILEGDATGGGHQWPGLPGKSPFPEGWSGPRIMHEISDIATDPAAWENATIQGGRTVLTGVRGGVDIRVIVNSRTGDIITGYPTNLLRNP